MTSAPKLTVIVFAYNEEENVAAVLAELRGWLAANEPEAEIVFVDDGSKDRTADAAEAALSGMPHAVVRHEKNGGIGKAIKSGVRASRGTWITFFPCDGQIEPAAIGTLRARQKESGCEVVLSVYDHRDDGLDRKVFSFGVRALILGVHGVWMQSDGPYLFHRDLFDPDALPPDTFFLNFEFPIRMLAAKRSLEIVTIACRPRRAGQSKSTQWHRIVGVAKDLVDLRVRRTAERFSTRGHAKGSSD
jgi:dolichol-phosphate mannosyltransferase